MSGRTFFSMTLLIIFALACNRVAIVEAPRGPQPSALPPPFHTSWRAYDVETSESEEYGTRLEYSTKRIPDELVQDLVARAPEDWTRVDDPGLLTWRTGLNLVRGRPRIQSMLSAAFRHRDGRFFVLSLSRDVGSAQDRPTEIRVTMVGYSATAASRALSEASEATSREDR